MKWDENEDPGCFAVAMSPWVLYVEIGINTKKWRWRIHHDSSRHEISDQTPYDTSDEAKEACEDFLRSNLRTDALKDCEDMLLTELLACCYGHFECHFGKTGHTFKLWKELTGATVIE